MQAAGESLPDWYVDKPPPVPWADFYRSAYWNLDTERHVNGWTIPPIPESKIHAYGWRHGLRGEVLDAFVFLIRQMDVAHMKWMRDEIEAAKPPPR